MLIGQYAAVALIAAAGLATGCSPSPDAKQYELRGQILAVRPDANEVLIKHGDIKNFMPGMTMPFRAKNPAVVAGLAAGDLVTAQLMVGVNEAWLAKVERTGTAPLDQADQAVTIPPAAFVMPLKPGDAAPTTSLIDATGKPVDVNWRGTATAVTFIYLRCPLPQFCPLLDRRFAEIQRALQADPALRARARLLSVSFDPANDTPAALRAHAAKLGADPQLWRFATASAPVVDRFAANFGVNVIRESDGTITHNLRIAVIGPDGRVVAIHDGGDWTTDQVIQQLQRSLAAQ
ncbi:MAG TPA: SCO family protein [Vicinamibacterales bacterium]|nr:SCO family protein [Vicinamibacterales bacterium]